MRTCLYMTAVSLLTVVALLAQGGNAQQAMTVRGEITSDGPIPGSLTLEVDGNGSGPIQSVMVHVDGSFEVPGVTPGLHEFRVVASGGGVISSQQIVVQNPNQQVSIRIDAPRGSANRMGGGNTVSIQQLNHKVPPAAQSAFSKGERFAVKGSYREAADAFREAITVDPEFADAYNELAAAEAELGQLPESAEHFQKAIDLVPEHRFALPNLSIVLAKMKRYREAGEVARRALKIVPGSCKVHYILAASLIEEDGNLDEALEHLTRAVPEVPTAHLVAADLLVQQGRKQDAVRHLEEYLRGAKPNDAYRARVEARLVELQQ
jgi:tetratricopeptide (TPR) repeat protein